MGQERSAMQQMQRSEIFDGDLAAEPSASLPDRLPWPLAALVIGALASGLWAGIFLAFRALA